MAAEGVVAKLMAPEGVGLEAILAALNREDAAGISGVRGLVSPKSQRNCVESMATT